MDEFYDYDQKTGILVWTDAWAQPSPVEGVCLGEYREFVAAIHRAGRLTPSQLFAQNEELLAFARRYSEHFAGG